MHNNDLTIKACIEKILETMHDLGYSKGNIEAYEHSYNTFLKFCNQNNYTYFREEIALEFLKQTYDLELKCLVYDNVNTKHYRWRLRHLRVLSEYSRNQIFISKFSKFHKPVEKDDYWNKLYTLFMNHLKNDCDYADSTIRSKELTIRTTMNFLIQLDIHSLDEISPKIINKIISKFIHESSKSVTYRIRHLKQFFTFCFDNNLCRNDISSIIPDVTIPHAAYLPASWSADEAKQLLDSIDRTSSTGKRDYAILLIACRLGLRACDICRLQLEDFNWETKEIHLIQKKTQNAIVLPLLNDIGWAVIDYIKNGRPKTRDSHLFIRAIPPYNALAGSSAIENIFTFRIHNAGLRIPRGKNCGIHSLRHTLGSILLEKETPLPIISQILGHQSIKSTSTYLRLNMKGLAECPIDPDKVFNNEI